MNYCKLYWAYAQFIDLHNIPGAQVEITKEKKKRMLRNKKLTVLYNILSSSVIPCLVDKMDGHYSTHAIKIPT